MHFLTHLLISWLLSALALWIVAQIISGIEVRSFGAAMIATLVINVVSAFLKPILAFLHCRLLF